MIRRLVLHLSVLAVAVASVLCCVPDGQASCPAMAAMEHAGDGTIPHEPSPDDSAAGSLGPQQHCLFLAIPQRDGTTVSASRPHAREGRYAFALILSPERRLERPPRRHS